MKRRDFLGCTTAAFGWAASSRVSSGTRTEAKSPLPARPASTLKLTEARVYIVSIGGRYPVVVELLTDQGIRGAGEAGVAYGTGATAAAGMIKDLAQQFLPARDPFAIAALLSDMYDHTFWAKGGGTIVFAGISAIEQALWDIKGKALGLPVYEMLGGRLREEARVYANGWSFRAVQAGDFARAAERPLKDGYTAVKLYPLATAALDAEGHIRHVTRRSIDREAEDRAVAIVRAVRQAVGSKIDIMLDVSAELTTDAIIRFAHKVEDQDILWLEEPVDPFDIEALKKVSDQVRIPIAAGERLYARYGFRRALELHALDIAQPDVSNAGGILETLKITAMAETYNIRVAPHNAGGPVATAAALHVDACTPNFFIQELYPYRVPEHFAVVDHAPELAVKNGFVSIPTRPGLGVELVEDKMRPHLWTTVKL